MAAETPEKSPDYNYITHLNLQPPSCEDDTQWSNLALTDCIREKLFQPSSPSCSHPRAYEPMLATNDDLSVVPSFPREFRYQKREVIILAVHGSSGAGKSCLAHQLCHWLQCPWEPIGTDVFRRSYRNLPCCPHQATDPKRQWNQKFCYDLPASYDLQLLQEELAKLRHVTATSEEGQGEPFWFKTPQYGVLALKRTPYPLVNAPTYIVIEGFVVLAEPAIVSQLDHVVWLQIPWELAAERRFNRERRRHASKQSFENFILTYKDHIYKAEQSCVMLYCRNVSFEVVHCVDASQSPCQVLHAVLQSLPSDHVKVPVECFDDEYDKAQRNRKRTKFHMACVNHQGEKGFE